MSKLDLDTARDVLADALGIRRNDSGMSAIAIFSAGALFGSALVLLFAPKRVGEIGSQLGERIKDVRDRVVRSSDERVSRASA
jgi:gas vesicle protein